MQPLLDSGKLDGCTFGYVSEPTNLQIATRLKGGIEYTARTFGKNAHTGQAYLGENAIFKMAKVISALEYYNSVLRKSIYDEELKYPTSTVGVVHGGTGVTFVPNLCEIQFDRQFFPQENIEDVKTEIKDLFNDLKKKYGMEIELIYNQSFPAWEISRESEVVKNLVRAYSSVLQKEPGYGILNGYAEVEMLDSAGIPSVLFGPGDDGTAHSYNERVSVDEVIKGAEVYAELARQFCSPESLKI